MFLKNMKGVFTYKDEENKKDEKLKNYYDYIKTKSTIQKEKKSLLSQW